MTLRDILRLLRRYWVLFLVLIVLGVAGGLGLGYLQKPQYQSTTRVYVSTPAASNLQDLTVGADYVQSIVTTYASVAAQPIVLDKVVDQLNLPMSASALASQVSASAIDQTSLLQITVTANSAKGAADIANSIATNLTTVVGDLSPRTGTSKTDPVALTVTQTAQVSTDPVSPNIVRMGLLGLVIGLVLALVIAFLRQALDTKIRTDADVRTVTDRPVLGSIGFDKNAASAPLIVQSDPRGLRAETFRTLRTNLQFLGLQRPDNAFVITSSTSGEGKSTTSTNLALVTADTGASVLLIDADLRRPKVADYLGLPSGAGLAEVLSGQTGFDDVVQVWGEQRLAVLTSGAVPPNPSELLQGHRMDELLRTVCDRYDYVILDAPPLLPVSDAAIIARKTAGVIVLCAINRAHKNHLGASLSALESVDATVLGLVETMVPAKQVEGYGYGYGYGYGGYGHVSVSRAEKRAASKAGSAQNAKKKTKQSKSSKKAAELVR